MVQNVLDPGGATLEIGGSRKRTTHPRVIRADGSSRRSRRAALRLIGADEFLLLDG